VSIPSTCAKTSASSQLQAGMTCPSPAALEHEQSGPEISIADVSLSGPVELPVTEQEQIADSIKQQTHGKSIDLVTDEALERVRSGWQNQGYLKVLVSGEPRILESDSVSRRIALSVHVEEGPQYRLGEIMFKNNRAISNLEALRKLFPIKDGDIFSREKIAKGLENLRDAYERLGYINFTPVPDTTFDEDKKLVNVIIDVDEGKQYYVSGVKILGLDETGQEEVLKNFPMKRGQIYNGRLLKRFLLKHASVFSASHRSKRTLNDQAGTVTFTFDFRPCPAD